MPTFVNNAIFWVEVEKVKPNPFQPRREFDEERLKELSESIRMYGVLQPLVVTRKEITRDDGSLFTEYELISGERRLRASRLAGILQVPVIIRGGEENDREKLELAIIENLQREDLNPVDRARAFLRLADEFGFKHADIGKKVGKSREYVSNTMRILDLPEPMLQALSEGRISEGHTRPLLMLSDRPEEQALLLQEIVIKKITVRDAESTARRIAVERARKRGVSVDPELRAVEQKLCESLGTRVTIERSDSGGKIHIDFFSPDDLRSILQWFDQDSGLRLAPQNRPEVRAAVEKEDISPAASQAVGSVEVSASTPEAVPEGAAPMSIPTRANAFTTTPAVPEPPNVTVEEEEIYSVKNFSI